MAATLEDGVVPAPRDAFADRVHEAQVRHLYDELPAAVAASVAGAVLLATVMWPSVPHGIVFAWTVAMLVNQAWRFALHLRFRRRSGYTAKEISQWGTWWAVAAGLSGLIWGSAAFLFWVDGSGVLQTILIASIFAVTSAAVLLIGTHLQSFYPFVLGALAPLIARAILQGDPPYMMLALITTIATVGIIAFGLSYNRSYVTSLRNRFENEALAHALAAQNAALDQAWSAAERARRDAEFANRSKTQFFAAASHDLRQPLHALGLFAEALCERVRDPGVAQVVRSINASVGALETLVDELLDISRIDAGVLKVSMRQFPLQDVLDRLRLEFLPEAMERGLRLRVRPSAAHVLSDPVLVERIVRNLVANALRYTRRGGVLIACRLRGTMVSLEVWDTGVGIPEPEQQRVFDEFYQVADPEGPHHKGMGLGLAIVKRLGGLIGASVTLRSKPGRGTVFSVTLPLGNEPHAPAIPAAVAAETRTTLAGRRIVVIEDERDVLEGMRLLLGGWHAEVISAASADEALTAVAHESRVPDLVIADYQLGNGANGAQAIESIRMRYGTAIPGIVVTGSITLAHRDEARAKGYHLLAKPVAPAKLRALIGFKLAR